MKFQRHLIVAASSLATARACAAADHDTKWGYAGHGSPETWGELSPKFSVCFKGMSQSPINITETVEGHLPALKVSYRPSKVEVINNGHTIQANYSGSNNTLRVGDKVYTLKQLHFHAPSET